MGGKCKFRMHDGIVVNRLIALIGFRYMIPDTMAKLSLYVAEEFPSKWRLEKHLLDHRLVDASIVFYKNVWCVVFFYYY